jgi:hypothetical protein
MIEQNQPAGSCFGYWSGVATAEERLQNSRRIEMETPAKLFSQPCAGVGMKSRN